MGGQSLSGLALVIGLLFLLTVLVLPARASPLSQFARQRKRRQQQQQQRQQRQKQQKTHHRQNNKKSRQSRGRQKREALLQCSTLHVNRGCGGGDPWVTFSDPQKHPGASETEGKCVDACARTAQQTRQNTCCFFKGGRCFLKPGAAVVGNPPREQLGGSAAVCQYQTAQQSQQQPQASSACRNFVPFSKGDDVVVHNLVSSVSYNGATAKVLDTSGGHSQSLSDFNSTLFHIFVTASSIRTSVRGSNLRRQQHLLAGDIVRIHGLLTRGMEHNGHLACLHSLDRIEAHPSEPHRQMKIWKIILDDGIAVNARDINMKRVFFQEAREVETMSIKSRVISGSDKVKPTSTSTMGSGLHINSCGKLQPNRGCKSVNSKSHPLRWIPLAVSNRGLLPRDCVILCEEFQSSSSVNGAFCCFFDQALGCFAANNATVSTDDGDTGLATECHKDEMICSNFTSSRGCSVSSGQWERLEPNHESPTRGGFFSGVGEAASITQETECRRACVVSLRNEGHRPHGVPQQTSCCFYRKDLGCWLVRGGDVSAQPRDVGNAAVCGWTSNDPATLNTSTTCSTMPTPRDKKLQLVTPPSVLPRRTDSFVRCEPFADMRGCRSIHGQDTMWKPFPNPYKQLDLSACMELCAQYNPTSYSSANFCCFFEPTLGCFVMENGTVSRDAGDRGWAANCRDSQVLMAGRKVGGVNEDDEMFDLEPNDLLSNISRDNNDSSRSLEASETLESMAQRLKSLLLHRVRRLLSQRYFRRVQGILNAIICKGLAHGMFQSVVKGDIASNELLVLEWSREQCHGSTFSSIEFSSGKPRNGSTASFALLWSEVAEGPAGLRRELKHMVIQALVIRAQLSASLGNFASATRDTALMCATSPRGSQSGYCDMDFRDALSSVRDAVLRRLPDQVLKNETLRSPRLSLSRLLEWLDLSSHAAKAYASGNFSTCVDVATRLIVEVAIEDLDMYILRGRCELGLGRLSDVRSDASHVLATRPRSAEALWLAAVSVFHSTADVGRTEKILTFCVKIDPDAFECGNDLISIRGLSRRLDAGQRQLHAGRQKLQKYFNSISSENQTSVSQAEGADVACLIANHMMDAAQIYSELVAEAGYTSTSASGGNDKAAEGKPNGTTKMRLSQSHLPSLLLHRVNILSCVVLAEMPPQISWLHRVVNAPNTNKDTGWFPESSKVPKDQHLSEKQGAEIHSVHNISLNSTAVMLSCSAAVAFLGARNHGGEFSKDHREALAIAYLVRARAILALHQGHVAAIRQDLDENNEDRDELGDGVRSFMSFRFGQGNCTPSADSKCRRDHDYKSVTLSTKHLLAASSDLRMSRHYFPQLGSFAADMTRLLHVDTSFRSGAALYYECSRLLTEFQKHYDNWHRAESDGSSHGCSGENDFYDILEVDRNASFKSIKRAYRQLALKWHPDKYSSLPRHYHDAYPHVVLQEEVVAFFIHVSEAYDVLSDDLKRAEYDEKCKFESLWEGGKDARHRATTGEGFNGHNPSTAKHRKSTAQAEQDAKDYFEQQDAREKAARERWQREQAAVWVFPADINETQGKPHSVNTQTWTYGWQRPRDSCGIGTKRRMHRGWVTRGEQPASTQAPPHSCIGTHLLQARPDPPQGISVETTIVNSHVGAVVRFTHPYFGTGQVTDPFSGRPTMFAVVEGKIGLSGHVCRHALIVEDNVCGHVDSECQRTEANFSFSIALGATTIANQSDHGSASGWMEPNSVFDSLYLVACSSLEPRGCEDAIGQHCSVSKKIPDFHTPDVSLDGVTFDDNHWVVADPALVASGKIQLIEDQLGTKRKWKLFRRAAHLPQSRTISFDIPTSGPIGIHFRSTTLPSSPLSAEKNVEVTGEPVGVWVDFVDDGSRAQQAGIQNGERLVRVNGESVRNATLTEAVAMVRKTLQSPVASLDICLEAATVQWHRGGDLLLSNLRGFYPAVYDLSPNVHESAPGLVDDDEMEDLDENVLAFNAFQDVQIDAQGYALEEIAYVPTSTSDSTLELAQEEVQGLFALFQQKLRNRGVDVSVDRARQLFDKQILSSSLPQKPLPPWCGLYSFSKSLSQLDFATGIHDPAQAVSQVLLSTGNGKYWAIMERQTIVWAWNMFQRRLLATNSRRNANGGFVRSTERRPEDFKWDNLSGQISEVDGSTPMALASHLSGSPHPLMIRFSVSVASNHARTGKKPEFDLEISTCAPASHDTFEGDSWDFGDDEENPDIENDSQPNRQNVNRHILYREGPGWGRLSADEDRWVRENGGLNVWLR